MFRWNQYLIGLNIIDDFQLLDSWIRKELKAGENFFLLLPYCNTDSMNVFLEELAKEYKEDKILLVCDGATWHKSKGLKIPENIEIIHI